MKLGVYVYNIILTWLVAKYKSISVDYCLDGWNQIQVCGEYNV